MNAGVVVEETAKVLAQRPLIPDIFLLTLELPAGWGPALPGQFVQLECPPVESFGLRRPFGLSSCRPGGNGVEIEIIYGVVGTRTRGLSRVREGDRVRLFGPLGRSYRRCPDRTAVLVAGGRGIGPILMLAEHWKDSAEGGQILYGVRNEEMWIPVPAASFPVHQATDDGSMGFHGTVVDLLQDLVGRQELRVEEMALYACGPNQMLASLSRWAMDHGVPCEVSLETTFGCGFGICAGCAIPLRSVPGEERDEFGKYVLACREGPVMDGTRVDWEGVAE